MSKVKKERVRTKQEILAGIRGSSRFRSSKKWFESADWERMNTQIRNALDYLHKGQDILRQLHQKQMAKSKGNIRSKGMTFALDGRLVGDIGELIAAEVFCIELRGTKSVNIDAVTTSIPRRKVQIKATFGKEILSIKHPRDYFLGLQLNQKGQFRVIYNGPARPVMEYLKAPRTEGHQGRKNAGNRLEPISLGAWAILNRSVRDADRIPRRKR
jgi:hypothetical protein